MSRVARRLSMLFRRRRWEAELDEELRLHLDLRTAQLQSEGLPTGEARRRARLELGMQGLHRDDARRAWGLERIDLAVQSLRLAWRSLWRTPGYTLTAVGVLTCPLALGVLLYALFSAYALQMPPVAHAERWFYIDGRTNTGRAVALFTAAEAAALVADPPAQVEGLYSARPVSAMLTTDRDYRGLGEAVSDSLFRLFGLPAAQGRLWFGGDDPRDRDTLLLSARGAEKLFAAGVDPLGKRVDVAGKAFTVIGVVGAAYSGLMPVGALYWIRAQDLPAQIDFNAPEDLRVEVGGIRRQDVSLDAVAAALSARAAALSLERDAELQLVSIDSTQRRGLLREHDREEALLAGAPVALLVLLILAVAAANLANLVLARYSARRHDMALRAAIGAGRRQLFLGMLIECVLLGQLAALFALGLVALLMQPIHDAVFGLMTEFGFDLHTLRIGWDALAICLLLGLLASVCFGALPSWWLTAPYATGGRADPDAAALKKAEPRGLRGGLMGLQLAGSVFLIVLAGLVASNARITHDTALGFDPSRMVSLGGMQDDGRLARELSALPNVAAVAATSGVPLMGEMPAVNALRDGRSDRLRLRYVDAGWWAMMNLPLHAGRSFSAAEGEDAGSAIVSERAARLLWPERMALGERVRLQRESDDGSAIDRQVEVVGVVGDAATGLLFGDPLKAVIYLPARPGSSAASNLLLQLNDVSWSAVAQLERDCQRIAAEAACRPLRLTDALTVQRLPFAVASRISHGLAWLALGISCIGLYGLVSYALVQQRKELGVRMALGARAGDVVRHVMRGAARPLLIGLLIGITLAAAGSRMLAHLTEYVRAFSLEAFLLQPLLLLAIALLAAWLPARRASRIAPSECLRAD